MSLFVCCFLQPKRGLPFQPPRWTAEGILRSLAARLRILSAVLPPVAFFIPMHPKRALNCFAFPGNHPVPVVVRSVRGNLLGQH